MFRAEMNMKTSWIGRAAFALMAAVLMWAPVWGQAEFPVATKTLKNGMKVLVQTDHSIPNVALYIFYRIGSRNEGPGTTGLSHFFEHMMFNGAKKYGPGDLDKVMEANGGANNAYTTRDVTVYQDWFPRSALSLIYDIEADSIQNLSFDPQKIKSEREVVASERRLRTDNDNGGLLDEQLWATSYIAHPYQWPVVGWMSDIEHWTMEQLKHHFEMGYSPNNATMVVAGDVSPEEIFQLCEKYIEPIPMHAPTPHVVTEETEQTGGKADGRSPASSENAGAAAIGATGVPHPADEQPRLLRAECFADGVVPGRKLADVPALGGQGPNRAGCLLVRRAGIRSHDRGGSRAAEARRGPAKVRESDVRGVRQREERDGQRHGVGEGQKYPAGGVLPGDADDQWTGEHDRHL